MMIKWTKTIKFKFTALLGIIVFILLVLSNLFVFNYFRKILIYDNLSKYLIVLDNEISKMNSEMGDIRNLAQNIVLNDNIQSFCKEKGTPDYYDVIRVSETLDNLIGINNFVHSSMLVKEGQGYWSQYPFDKTFKNILEEEWIKDMENDEMFSSVYSLKYGYEEKKLISYKVAIYDMDFGRNKIGELFLNIDIAAINATFKSNNSIFDNYIINNTEVIASNTNTPLSNIGREDFQEILDKRSGVKKDVGGYILWGRMENEWNMLSYITSDDVVGITNKIWTFFILFFPVTVIIAMYGIYITISKMTDPIRKITREMDGFAKGNKQAQVYIQTGDEMELMGNQFNTMVADINSNIERIIEVEKVKKKFKFDLLMSKIHPHFIYNTLSSAIFLARNERNKDVVIVIKALILILQDSMSVHSDKVIDTVENEINLVRNYEVIQHFKYKDKFKIDYEICQDCLQIEIPKNIIQPIVENSIFHGVAPSNESTIITVSINSFDDTLVLVVADDGVGMSEETVEKLKKGEKASSSSAAHSIGLSSIIERLDYFYGKDYKFDVESQLEIGTVIQIELPLSNLTHNILKEN